MGPGFSFLTLLFSLLFFGSSAFAGEPKCLACHPEHYEERRGCVDCHRGNPRTEREDIAHHGLIEGRFAYFTIRSSLVAERGVRLIESYACRRCHISGGRGNKLAVDLDGATRNSTPGELFEAIEKPAIYMPEFHLPQERAVEVVNALLKESGKGTPSGGEVPVVVHFEEEGAPEENLFVKKCGSCHRLLARRLGGLGSGAIAPNLSGLLSEHYWKNFGEEKKGWTFEGLEKWLKNPRQIRKLTRMPPIPLEEGELKGLREILEEER